MNVSDKFHALIPFTSGKRQHCFPPCRMLTGKMMSLWPISLVAELLSFPFMEFDFYEE